MATITLKEMLEKIESGEAQILNLEKAKSLKGVRIATTYTPYCMNTQLVKEFTVGEILSEYDHASEERKKYWETAIDKDRILKLKQTSCLLTDNGEETYMRVLPNSEKLYGEPTFICSDEDRPVYFFII
ncbi:hypothetical protein MASR1M31_04510 [Porphyromonadaceae bacterium]